MVKRYWFHRSWSLSAWSSSKVSEYSIIWFDDQPGVFFLRLARLWFRVHRLANQLLAFSRRRINATVCRPRSSRCVDRGDAGAGAGRQRQRLPDQEAFPARLQHDGTVSSSNRFDDSWIDWPTRIGRPPPRFDFFVCVCVCVCCFRFVLCWHLHDFDVDCLWWWWWWWWKKPNRRPKTNQRCGVWWRRWASTFSWSACAPSTPSRRATCPKTSTRPNSSASPCTRRASSGWPLCPSTSAPSPRPSRSASASPYRKTFSFLLGFPNLPWGRDPYPEPAPPAPKRRNLIDMENNRFNQGTHLFDGFPNSFWGRDPYP